MQETWIWSLGQEEPLEKGFFFIFLIKFIFKINLFLIEG